MTLRYFYILDRLRIHNAMKVLLTIVVGWEVLLARSLHKIRQGCHGQAQSSLDSLYTHLVYNELMDI